MSTTRLTFTPPAVLPPLTDRQTGATSDSRKTTSEEQRREAVAHALLWCAAHRVWIVEVLVQWTRREPTVLTVRGHGEHARLRPGAEPDLVPVLDRVTEADLNGRAIVTSLAEDQMTLEREVSEIYDGGLE